MHWVVVLVGIMLVGFPHEGNARGWQVDRRQDANGCVMVGEVNAAGIEPLLFIFKNGDWSLALNSLNGSLNVGATAAVQIYVDGKYVGSARGKNISKALTKIPIGDQGAFRRAAQTGRSLEIVAPGGRFTFALRGAGSAMNELVTCFDRIRRTAGEPECRQIAHSEASAMLAAVLDVAGVSDYRAEPPTPGEQVAIGKFADGTSLVLGACQGATADAADLSAEQGLKSAARQCRGELNIGRQTIPSSDGSIIRKVTTTCRTDPGTIFKEEVHIRRPDRLLISFGQIASSVAMPADDARRAGLIDALVKVARQTADPPRTMGSVMQEIHKDTRTEQIVPSKKGASWVKISWIRPTSMPADEECEIDLRKAKIGDFEYEPGTHFGDACAFTVTDSAQGRGNSVFLWGKASPACYPYFYIRENSHLTCLSIQSRLEFLTRQVRTTTKADTVLTPPPR